MPGRSKTTHVLITLLFLINSNHGECWIKKQTATSKGSVTWQETTIDFDKMLLSILQYTKLVQEQLWFNEGNLVVTQKHDISCSLMSTGFDIDKLQNQMFANVTVPLLTSVYVLDQQILFAAQNTMHLVSKNDFSSLVQHLNLQDRIDPKKNHRVVFIKTHQESILTNYNQADNLACHMDSFGSNLQHALNRLIGNLNLTWLRAISVAKILNLDTSLTTFKNCLGLPDYSLDFLLLVPAENFDFCVRGAFPSSKVISKRDISLASLVFGDGQEILNVQRSLHNTIEAYNSNFEKVQEHEKLSYENILALKSSFENVAEQETQDRVFIRELYFLTNQQSQRMKFSLVKFQQIIALADILHTSLVDEQLDLIHRSILQANICSTLVCEADITSQVVDKNIIVHRQIIQLEPKTIMTLKCEAYSHFQVSTWHNTEVFPSGSQQLLVRGRVTSSQDLKNNTLINQDLRPIKPEERIFKVFFDIGHDKIQCLTDLNFNLNGKSLHCQLLEVITLHHDFKLDYNNQVLTKQGLLSKSQTLASSWMQDFAFDNLPATHLEQDTPDQAIFHPIIDSIVLTPAGTYDSTNITLMSGTTIFLIAFCCLGCCYKFQSYREGSWNLLKKMGTSIYNCFTTQRCRTIKENRALQKECDRKREQIVKNLNDIELFQRTINSQGTHLSSSTPALDGVDRRGVTFHPSASLTSLQELQ